MNIKITDSWLREYLKTEATPEEIQKHLSLCGPSIERIEQIENDVIYDIEITSNRVDTASVIGIAQEAVAILNRAGFASELLPLQTYKQDREVLNTYPITIIDESKLCRRILAVVISDVQLGKSPEYIQKRLDAAGIRSLNNLVDITNYVMLEVGHPTHVFDYDRIATKKLIIRHAKLNEAIVTLDEKEYRLSNSDIIIDDGTGRVIDLPGIMGTSNSVVTDQTKHILFFIESNDPVAIRKSSMTYGIRTMAATLNEKSPDPYLAKTALLRGIYLYKTIAQAKTVGPIIDIFPTPPVVQPITVNVERVNAKIGTPLSKKEIIAILGTLGCTIAQEGDSLTVIPPTSRWNDLHIEEDIIEEIARIYGYHVIPSVLQPMKYVSQPKDTKHIFEYQHIIKTYLKHAGLHEVMNYSAVSKTLLDAFNQTVDSHLYITNSISEEVKYLRQSLIPSLVQNCKQNEGFSSKLSLFEVAKTYIPRSNNLPKELVTIAGIVTTSFSDMKGILDGLLAELYITTANYSPGSSPFFSSHVQGKIQIDTHTVGVYGKIKSTFSDKLAIQSSLYAFELDFLKLIAHAKRMPQYRHFSQYAIIHLDVSIPHTKTYAEIKKIAYANMPHLLDIHVQSTFKNTITLHLSFTHNRRNLTEKEAIHEIELFKTHIEG